jgi:hypothetical protein
MKHAVVESEAEHGRCLQLLRAECAGQLMICEDDSRSYAEQLTYDLNRAADQTEEGSK